MMYYEKFQDVKVSMSPKWGHPNLENKKVQQIVVVPNQIFQGHEPFLKYKNIRQ